jgi:tetratricopeptide (TPR) repeat protein
MNKAAISFVLSLASAGAIFAQAPSPAQPTPAEISIAKAQERIARQPDRAANYDSLAMAYARRARETSDVAFYTKAEETLQQAFKMAPDDFEAAKVRTWLLLGRHEFAKALDAASKLNKKMPDDVLVFGYLADANTELGNYPEAVQPVQWMLNMKPGNIPGLTRAAYQRELHGDIAGAIELMRMAHDSTPFQELEDRAWILTQIGHLYLIEGDVNNAELYAKGALDLFKGYHYAQGVLAQVRTQQKRYDEAVALLEARYQTAPHAENLYALGEALERAGRHQEAAKTFAEFEPMSLKESGITDNSNHELIAYYVDFAKQPEKALKIADLELSRRRDVFTLDCHAWALAANGDYARAGVEIRQAIAVGVKDPRILEHARVIQAHLQQSGTTTAQASVSENHPQ